MVSVTMKKDIALKLWVIKFCLKVIYPKFNYLTFLVFLAVKYRKQYHSNLAEGKSMDTFKIKAIPAHVQRLLCKDYLDNNTSVILHKCLIISRNQFIDLASENLFYLDNGVLWVTMKLSAKDKKRFKQKQNSDTRDKFLKYNLSFITSEVHKRLWANSYSGSLDKCRIVPLLGSKHVEENVVSTTEAELHNITSLFDRKSSGDIEISFHPVLTIESAPKIAAAAEVSLIVNDYDLSNDFLKEVLSNHFELPKLIHINDIFSIELSPEITSKYHYKYSDLIESIGKLYFKCQKLNSDPSNENQINNAICNAENIDQPFFIVKNVTQLSLGEGIHQVKPRDEYFKLPETNDNQKLDLSSCPTGLKQKVDQIQETIAPFLSGDLNELTSSLSSPIIPMLMLTGSTGSGRHLLVKSLAKYNGMNCLQVDCNALQSSTAKQTESKISSTIQKAKTASPVIVLMDNFEVFAVDPENNEDCRVLEYFVNSLTDLYQNYTKHTIVFIAVTERSDLKPNILRIFLEKFHIPKLNSKQRFEMLEWFTSVMDLKLDKNETNDQKRNKTNSKTDLAVTPSKEILQRVAAKTETFIYGDLDTLVHFALRESYLEQHHSEALPDPNMHLVQEQHFNSALESMRKLQSQNLDAPKIPKVYWEDIGGLDKLKKELLKTIEFPIKYPHLFKTSSLKRSGILLYGPPGCGKTLVAKAVSTELNVSFLSVKGPELLNMYIGQSEENVRRVFETARAASPCIVFLDELDAMAARRGASGDSGGASDRLVSQLLAELDGVTTQQDADSTSFVFVMGATNRPDLLEQSLLRPGRLDKLIYVGPYCGLEEKTNVLTALCRSHKLRPEVKLEDVAMSLPQRCTGADLLQVVSTARSTAVRALVGRLRAVCILRARTARAVGGLGRTREHAVYVHGRAHGYTGLVKESELSPDSVIIGASEMLEGVNSFRPSVTDEELAYYESLENQM